MKQSFILLSVAKQVMVIIAVIIIFALLLNGLVWSPLQRGLSNAENASQKQFKLLQWMQQQKNVVDSLKASTTTLQQGEGRSISARINESAVQYGIDINRFQSLDQKQVQVWLEKADFSKLLIWLQELDSSYGVFVENITINETANSGHVSVSMTLSTLI